VSFLKDLSGLWPQFDERLLHHRVLPPVVVEMRNEVVALAALPLVLAIMGRMKPEGFAARWGGAVLCRVKLWIQETSSA
jgi:hypothetical protein